MPTFTGTSQDDTLTGTDQNDTLLGLAGNDQIDGGLGDDCISGGDGSDTLDGNFGDDSITGDAGDDVIRGWDGDDLLIGDSQADGSSTYGDGNDTIYASVGQDTLIGNGGDDVLFGQEGADSLDGGDGDDRLEGGDEDDTLSGGAGNDELNGGSGNSTLTGGEGFDRFVLTGDEGLVLVTDFNTASGQDLGDGDQSNNDFVDLGTNYYNAANLAAYNAANGTDYATPLEWMRADQGDDGVLNMLDGANGLPRLNLTLQNNGSAVSADQLTFDNTCVVCFAADTRIATARGEVAAGDLRVGDQLRTRDAGLQAIRWIGRRRLSAADLAREPKLRPIRIRAGALAANVPMRDLVVSPQHRVLVRSRIAQKMFGTAEVLVAAKQLCQVEGIDIAHDMDDVTYVHFMCDAHQIVFAEGAETETLYTGAEALRSVGPQALEEILALFPELAKVDRPTPARHMATGRMGRHLAVRHLRNGKPLVSSGRV